MILVKTEISLAILAALAVAIINVRDDVDAHFIPPEIGVFLVIVMTSFAAAVLGLIFTVY